MGLQASGKSSFYKERYFNTHVRVSLDLLKTRYREKELIHFCLSSGQKFVVDNTNPTISDRQIYLDESKEKGFSTIGFYFESKLEACLRRNQERNVICKVPNVALFSTSKKIELPSYREGFDEIYYVSIRNNTFVVKEWQDEI